MSNEKLIDLFKEGIDFGFDIFLEEEEKQMCIEALEKQIAKKIEEHNKTCKCRVFDYMNYECTQRVPYCCVCGQKIDWSEVE